MTIHSVLCGKNTFRFLRQYSEQNVHSYNPMCWLNPSSDCNVQPDYYCDFVNMTIHQTKCREDNGNIMTAIQQYDIRGEGHSFVICFQKSNMDEEEKKLSLDNQHFSQFTSSAFKDLYEDEDFTDVTLVCEDGNLVRGHKIILSAGSSVIRDLLACGSKPSHLINIPAAHCHILSIVRYSTSCNNAKNNEIIY